MTRYPLNLPVDLKQEAEQRAAEQGISLNQFIMWAVADKVAALRARLDDPRFPGITYRRGAAGVPTPTLRGGNVRVQTLVVAVQQWGRAPTEVAADYDLTPGQVEEALAFYAAHRAEIEQSLAAEATLEAAHASQPSPVARAAYA